MKFLNRKRQLVPVVNVIEIFSSSDDESEDDSEDEIGENAEIAQINPVIEISDDEEPPVQANEGVPDNPDMSDDDRPLDQLVRPVEPCPVLNISTDDSDDDRKSDDLDLDNVRWSSPSDSDSDSSDYGDEFNNPMIPGILF